MNPLVAELARIVRPPVTGGDQVDWDAWKREFGFGFPDDYRSFIEVYGGGTFSGVMSVLPLADGGKDWKNEFANTEDLFYDEPGYGAASPFRYPIHAGIGGLIIWGITSGPELCYWRASGHDPNKWTIAIYDDGEEWTQFDGGFVQYLLSLIRGESQSPFSFGFPPSNLEYLSWRDKRVLREAGVHFSYYYTDPGRVIAEIVSANLNPTDYFPSSIEYL